jgi:hypothetical protein
MELLKHPRVFALADMFQVVGLQKLAAAKFKDQLQQLWSSDTLPDCIREVYQTSVQPQASLRSIVVRVTIQNLDTLLQKPAFKGLLREGGDFALDMVQQLCPTSH